jgi:hypothetical protein
MTARFLTSTLIFDDAHRDAGPLLVRQGNAVARCIKTTPPAQPWASHLTTAFWKNEQISRAEQIRQSLHKMMGAAAIRPKQSGRFGLMTGKSLRGFAVDYRRAHATYLRKWQEPPVVCT